MQRIETPRRIDSTVMELLDSVDSGCLAQEIEVGLLARERLEADQRLTVADRADLEILIERGEQAWSRLVVSNVRLVNLAARRLQPRGGQFEDLVQSGSIGLLQAVMRWDHRLGYAFSTYAMYWIRQTMLAGYIQQAREIRLPTSWRSRLGEIARVRGELAQQHGRDPTSTEVAAAMGISLDDLGVALALLERPTSLDHDQVAASHGDNHRGPDEEVARRMLTLHVAHALAVLTERERQFVRLRFGLDDGIALSFDDVALRVGIHRERVRRVVNRALDKLRTSSRTAELLGYLA